VIHSIAAALAQHCCSLSHSRHHCYTRPRRGTPSLQPD